MASFDSVCVVHLRLCLANPPLSRRGAGSMGLFSERFRHRCRRCHCAARGAGAGALHGFCSVLCALSILLALSGDKLGVFREGGGGQRQRGMPLSKCRRTPSRRARRDCLFTPLPVPHVLDSSCEASETWPIASERPHDDSADMDVRAPSILIGCRRAPPPRRYLCSLRRPVPDGAHASASFLEPPADETLSARQLESPRRLSRSA